MEHWHPHRDSFGYWVWRAAWANWVLKDLDMEQKSYKWWRRYFTA